MDLGLSKKERDKLRADLAAAEPYEDTGYRLFDDRVYSHMLRGLPIPPPPPNHLARSKATMAKKLLEQDEREKKAAGLPLEPESTPASERRARQEAKSSHEN